MVRGVWREGSPESRGPSGELDQLGSRQSPRRIRPRFPGPGSPLTQAARLTARQFTSHLARASGCTTHGFTTADLPYACMLSHWQYVVFWVLTYIGSSNSPCSELNIDSWFVPQVIQSQPNKRSNVRDQWTNHRTNM